MNEYEYDAALKRVEFLMQSAILTGAQEKELERLGKAIEDYENECYPIPRPSWAGKLAYDLRRMTENLRSIIHV